MILSKYIDHTLLKAEASEAQIVKLCEEAKEYNFKSVCVHPSYLEIVKKQLQGTDILACVVIGFPLGMNRAEVKAYEAKNAILNGADEVDMVLNVGRLKNKEYDYVTKEIALVKEAVGDKVLKVIIEACLLNEEEKIKACECILKAKADFVKTSTGFSTGGATFADVELLKKCVGDKARVKAAGGIRTHEDLLKMIELGADRIGTSSGIKLLKS